MVMDPSIRLDYALFQLTPTRTRCDLVIFCGGKNEKLAHGLLEPFLSHLKFAKDEISKGGYSITLRPPASKDDASWFTKSTFERFVRFVSTPEILERFIALEKEISQIENEAYKLENEGSPTASNANSVKSSDSPKDETAENDDPVQEENSRIRLQRLLESRRAMLLRSQAMTYARGRAAGFDMDNMDELIAFSDAFGASRLRDACVEFKEICKKKQSDVPWMEELSAMEAYSSSELSFPANSAIILANEMNYPSSDNNLVPNGSLDASKQESTDPESKKDDNISANKIQMQIPWPNQFPPYMYPMHQMPMYQGYPFPMMPPNGTNDPRWPHQDLKGESKFKTKSSKKERNLHKGEEEDVEDVDSEEDSQTESSESEGEKRRSSSTDQSQRKKHRKKKSSRTVVIRNINYIASKDKDKDDGASHDSSSSSEDEFSLKKKVEEAVGVFKKNHKSKRHNHKKSEGSNHVTKEEEVEESEAHTEKSTNENWGAFQNLLMRQEEEPNLNPERQLQHSQDEHFAMSNFDDEVSGGIQKVTMQRKVTDDSLVMAERSGEYEPNGKSIDFGNGENARAVLRRREFADDAVMLSGSFEGSQILHDSLPDSNGVSSLAKIRRSDDGFIVNQVAKQENGDANAKQVVFDGDFLDSMGKSRTEPQVDDSFMIQHRTSLDDSRDISMDLEYMSASQAENAANEEALESKHKGLSYEPDDLCVVLERENDSNRLSWTSGYDVDFSLADSEKSPAKEVPVETPDSSDGKVNSGKKKELSAGKDPRSRVVSRSPVGKSKPEAINRAKKPTLMNRTAAQKSKFEKEEEVRKRMEEMLLERQRRIAERTAASGSATSAKKSPVESKTAKASIKTERSKPPNRASVKV